MANRTNVTRLNFIGGEISPHMAGRTDLDLFEKSLSWCQNFIVLPQGPIQFRPGFDFVNLSNNNQAATLIPFQFSANDAVMIEATNQTFRFYRNDQIILNTPVNITGVSQTYPATVTANAHGFTNGQEVYISGVQGMPQINGNFYLVAGATTNTFQLTDQFGNFIDPSTFGTYTSGGTVASVYTLATPYNANDLQWLRYAQVGDIVYLVCVNPTTFAAYQPMILTRNGFTNWTISTFTFTNNPFTPPAVNNLSITGISQANPGVVTLSAATTALTVGQVLYFTNIGGMTQLNGNFYQVGSIIDSTHFTLADLNGKTIDTTSFGAYTSGGTIGSVEIWPSCVAFTADGRLAYGGSLKIPQGFWESELPTGTATSYNNFTTGSADNFAVVFQFAPVNNEIDNIQEMLQYGGNFALLGPSSVLQVYGAQPGQPVNPNAISTIPTIQGAAHVQPLCINWNLLFVDVNGTSLCGLQYNLAFTAYEAKDYNLTADHLGVESQFIKLRFMQWAQVDIVWVLRADGVLLGITFNNIENISAWHRHYIAGGDAKVLDIGVIRKTDGIDELWLVVQRTLNGQTYNSIEVINQWPIIPPKRSFYSGAAGLVAAGGDKAQWKANDQANWENATWEQLKTCSFLDMSLEYDGTARGATAGATITLSGTTGTITANSDQPVFQQSDVGQQFWKSYAPDGSGGGQAVISGYTSPNSVTLDTMTPEVTGANFDNTNPIPPGMWSIATNTVSNLGLFNNLTVDVMADGGGQQPALVTNSQIQLQLFASNVRVGFGYQGLIASQNIDSGGKTGPANSKPRRIFDVRTRVDNTVGVAVGTSEYNTSDLILRKANQIPNRVVPPFTGMFQRNVSDSSNPDVKQVVILKSDPSVCTIIALDMEIDTAEPP